MPENKSDLRVGIDLGNTNTDAAVLDKDRAGSSNPGPDSRAPGLTVVERQRGAHMDTEGSGTTVDLRLAIRRRRMHRDFEDRPVPKEVLAEMAWAASRAQQARRGVRNIVIVDDPDVMAVARLVLPGLALNNNAPAMLVLCTNLTRAREVHGDNETPWIDVGAACAHLGLYAQALGLGVCTVNSWSPGVVRELLGLPDQIRPDVTVAVGYVPPAPPPSPASGRAFAATLHYNRYDNPFEAAR